MMNLVGEAGDPKDIVVDLPLGFAGSTLSAPECPLTAMDSTHFKTAIKKESRIARPIRSSDIS